MTTEKARDLVSRFIHLAKQTTGANGTIHNSKQCALIAVDEAEKAEYNVLIKFGLVTKNYKSDYWQEVKQEIERL